MPPKIAPMDIPHIQELVCRSLSSQDIYQCTLVSRNWHKNLNRFLWRSITLRTKGALRRFLASPQAQNAPQLSYLIENLTSPYPDIFSRFLSTVVTRHTKDTRQDGRDASEDSQDSHPDVSVLEDLHRLFGETLLAQPSFQVSTSVTCQFNRLTELRSTCIDARDALHEPFPETQTGPPCTFPNYSTGTSAQGPGARLPAHGLGNDRLDNAHYLAPLIS